MFFEGVAMSKRELEGWKTSVLVPIRHRLLLLSLPLSDFLFHCYVYLTIFEEVLSFFVFSRHLRRSIIFNNSSTISIAMLAWQRSLTRETGITDAREAEKASPLLPPMSLSPSYQCRWLAAESTSAFNHLFTESFSIQRLSLFKSKLSFFDISSVSMIFLHRNAMLAKSK